MWLGLLTVQLFSVDVSKTTTQEPVSTSPLMLLLSIFCTVIGFVRLFIDLQADSKCFSHDNNYKFYLLRHILNFVGIILSTISAGLSIFTNCVLLFFVVYSSLKRLLSAAVLFVKPEIPKVLMPLQP